MKILLFLITGLYRSDNPVMIKITIAYQSVITKITIA